MIYLYFKIHVRIAIRVLYIENSVLIFFFNRLRADMISRPQGDFKHTGHIGLDGAFFGDVAFLEKYDQLPKQIVTPCKFYVHVFLFIIVI